MLVMDKISTERKKRGMTLEELSALVGIDKATLSRYEKGVIRKIPMESLQKITSVLECDFDDFVAEDPVYCVYSTNGPSRHHPDLSMEDEQLLIWFHSLPFDYRQVIKQFWSLPIRTGI